MNLGRIPGDASKIGLNEEQRQRVVARVEQLLKTIESMPKTTGWKMRAVIGERKRWYELPEADLEVVDSGFPSAK
jgi:hypothetical protein